MANEQLTRSSSSVPTRRRVAGCRRVIRVGSRAAGSGHSAGFARRRGQKGLGPLIFAERFHGVRVFRQLTLPPDERPVGALLAGCDRRARVGDGALLCGAQLVARFALYLRLELRERRFDLLERRLRE